MLDILEEIIQRCQIKGMKLYIYISQLHPKIKAISNLIMLLTLILGERRFIKFATIIIFHFLIF